ncbi:hypothetical protein H5410_022436 [Solanum commersonii]|uniref:Uncharacterized protein n=1 Tax=Solanum commersonii TaxID=4109 RepID=A0A9J5ZDZ7_SOLCO|nr:hypothetical protein H5410_022436 [Solanum commersonii]
MQVEPKRCDEAMLSFWNPITMFGVRLHHLRAYSPRGAYPSTNFSSLNICKVKEQSLDKVGSHSGFCMIGIKEIGIMVSKEEERLTSFWRGKHLWTSMVARFIESRSYYITSHAKGWRNTCCRKGSMHGLNISSSLGDKITWNYPWFPWVEVIHI